MLIGVRRHEHAEPGAEVDSIRAFTQIVEQSAAMSATGLRVFDATLQKTHLLKSHGPSSRSLRYTYPRERSRTSERCCRGACDIYGLHKRACERAGRRRPWM